MSVNLSRPPAPSMSQAAASVGAPDAPPAVPEGMGGASAADA
eukprot:CAMPEP_0181214386 /NCGR_PEP_ID=MMETSP1096-20121128/25424_1 /TAXON_ID=156174 ORGANISM="Chrysochromulina ericina, Strain CCMP281" /NCGR_SAMPLE_ID=MMETSP1096 /ASSEMBLY_ACC=CAM_ASM_000453 /LENGTH=41 /DNA_ID= /DNA_START= /DNA_END= /DNA_ORIENTATION=